MKGTRMKYMLLIYMAENAMTDDERQHCYGESTQLAHDLNANGQFLATAPLQPVATATSVQVRDGKRLVTDGPFAETRECRSEEHTSELQSLRHLVCRLLLEK